VATQIHHSLKKHKKLDASITIKINSFMIKSKWLSKWAFKALRVLKPWPKDTSSLKLTASEKFQLKNKLLWFNQNSNLRYQNQRRRRTAKERPQALKLTGHHKKTKSCLDLSKYMEMLLGIDFASLWIIKLKLDALKDIWRLPKSQVKNQENNKPTMMSKKLLQSLLQVTQALNGLQKKMNF
jgi:hypothetical protein